MPLLLFAAGLLAGYGLGWAAFRLARREGFLHRAFLPAERIILRWLVGIGVHGLALFALGSAGLVRPVPIAASTIALAVLGAFAAWRTRADFRLPAGGPAAQACAAAFAAASAFLLAMCWNPVLLIDTYAYHLTFPRQWLIHGGVFPTPYCVHGLFSHLWSWHAMGLLAIAPLDAIAPKLLQCATAIAAGGLVATNAHRAGFPIAGWLAGTAFLLSRQMVEFAPSSHVDAALAAYAIAGATAASRVFALGRRGRVEALVLAGILLGLAGGVKISGLYYGVVVFVAGVACVAAGWFAIRRRVEARRLRARVQRDLLAGLAGGVALVAVASPWLVRNAVLSGNPLAPFGEGVFPANDDYATLIRQFHESYGDFEDASPLALGYYGALARQTLFVLVQSYILDQFKLIAASMAGVLVAIARWRGLRRPERFLVVLAALLLPHAIMAPAWRFAFGGVAIGCVAAALGAGIAAREAIARFGGKARVAIGGVAVYLLAVQGVLVANFVHPYYPPRGAVPWGWYLGTEGQRAYREAHPEFQPLLLLEAHTTSEDLILSTEPIRANLWTDRRLLPLFNFVGEPILHIQQNIEGFTPEETAAYLRGLGVTHVLSRRTAERDLAPLFDVWMEALGHADDIGLYRLRAEPRPKTPHAAAQPSGLPPSTEGAILLESPGEATE